MLRNCIVHIKEILDQLAIIDVYITLDTQSKYKFFKEFATANWETRTSGRP